MAAHMDFHVVHAIVLEHAHGNLIARHAAGVGNERILFYLVIHVPLGASADGNGYHNKGQIAHAHGKLQVSVEFYL